MSKRRRFSGELKAKIALEALRVDRTLQEIAARHHVHPDQVGAWKRQAMEGLAEVFFGGGERRARDSVASQHATTRPTSATPQTATSSQPSSPCVKCQQTLDRNRNVFLLFLREKISQVLVAHCGSVCAFQRSRGNHLTHGFGLLAYG